MEFVLQREGEREGGRERERGERKREGERESEGEGEERCYTVTGWIKHSHTQYQNTIIYTHTHTRTHD